MAISLEDLDHPLVFLFVITLGVIGMMAVLSWGLSCANLTGPLGLFKGGTVATLCKSSISFSSDSH